MSVIEQKIYDQQGHETGTILTAVFNTPTTLLQKTIVERQLIEYAFTKLYQSRPQYLSRNTSRCTINCST